MACKSISSNKKKGSAKKPKVGWNPEKLKGYKGKQHNYGWRKP